jgi:dienelactone hydrolase
MNDGSLRPITMKSLRLALPFLALAALACSESEPTPNDGNDSGDPGAVHDGGAGDGTTTSDAPTATDAAGDAGNVVPDVREGGVDASRSDASSNDAPSDLAVRDVPADGASSDAPLVDAPSSDAPATDGGDSTVPRFPKTGKYSILIPTGADGGTGPDGGSADPAEVYYPDPPDLHTASYSFPIVLLFQGAKVARGFYSTVAASLAGYGFIVVTPDHMSNNVGGAGLYAELSEIAFAGAQMKIEAASSTAPVRGVVDTARIVLWGHSYGGASGVSGMANMCFPPIPGCTFTRPPELVGGVFYGTNLATPIFGVPALDTGGLPVLLVQGDKDGKALPADGLNTYNQLQKPPKAIISLLGANHYGVTDVDNPAGADPEVNAQTLDHAAGLASIGRWMGVFLTSFINGDMAARAALRSAGTLDSHVTITLQE